MKENPSKISYWAQLLAGGVSTVIGKTTSPSVQTPKPASPAAATPHHNTPQPCCLPSLTGQKHTTTIPPQSQAPTLSSSSRLPPQLSSAPPRMEAPPGPEPMELDAPPPPAAVAAAAATAGISEKVTRGEGGVQIWGVGVDLGWGSVPICWFRWSLG